MGENGPDVKRATLALPAAVIVKLFVLLSINVGDWQVNNDVFVIAVSGAVGGVNVEVYTAVPFIQRKLEMCPIKVLISDPYCKIAPMRRGYVPDQKLTLLVLVTSSTPLTNRYQELPDLVAAQCVQLPVLTLVVEVNVIRPVSFPEYGLQRNTSFPEVLTQNVKPP